MQLAWHLTNTWKSPAHSVGSEKKKGGKKREKGCLFGGLLIGRFQELGVDNVRLIGKREGGKEGKMPTLIPTSTLTFFRRARLCVPDRKYEKK